MDKLHRGKEGPSPSPLYIYLKFILKMFKNYSSIDLS